MFYKKYCIYLLYVRFFFNIYWKVCDLFYVVKKINKINKYIYLKLNLSFLEKICIFFFEKYLGYFYICFVGVERLGW